MDKFVAAVAVIAALLFFGPVLGTAFGAFGGWVVGLFYSDTLGLLADRLGFPGADPWQLGAMLGFVGGFFKSTQTNKSGD